MSRVGCNIVFVLVALALINGCEQRPPLRMESEHFLIHADRAITLCPEMVNWLEQHFNTVGKALRVPQVARISIYLYKDREELDNSLSIDDGTDARKSYFSHRDRSVHVVAIADLIEGGGHLRHEIVHAYASYMGRPPSFFSEGLAEILACGLGPSTGMHGAIDRWDEEIKGNIVNEMSSYQVDWVSYSFGRTFSRFLIHREGLDKFLDLYTRLDGIKNRTDLEQAFEDVYEETPVSLVNEWLVSPKYLDNLSCLPIEACAQPSLTVGLENDIQLTCMMAFPPTFGYYYGFFRAVRTFELSEPTHLRISPEIGALGRCPDGISKINWPSSLAGELWTELDAGHYWIEFNHVLKTSELISNGIADAADISLPDKISMNPKHAVVELTPTLGIWKPRETREVQLIRKDTNRIILAPEVISKTKMMEFELSFKVEKRMRLETVVVPFDSNEQPMLAWICTDDPNDCFELNFVFNSSLAILEDHFLYPDVVYHVGWNNTNDNSGTMILTFSNE
jgi:hypothetical protein